MTDTTTPSPTDQPENQGFSVMRVVYIAFGALFGFFLLILGLAVWGASARADTFGPVVSVIRDIMIILVALEGILIVLALVVLIAQIARLVNLLQNEIKPILKNTQETVQHAKGTVEFVGKNLAEPVISANKFVAAAGAFANEIFRLRRVLSSRQSNNGSKPVEDYEKNDKSEESTPNA